MNYHQLDPISWPALPLSSVPRRLALLDTILLRAEKREVIKAFEVVLAHMRCLIYRLHQQSSQHPCLLSPAQCSPKGPGSARRSALGGLGWANPFIVLQGRLDSQGSQAVRGNQPAVRPEPGQAGSSFLAHSPERSAHTPCAP